jgi:hydroxyacylglutathione hydrolase
MDLTLERFTVGPLMENCYLLAADGRAVLVDPGDEGDRLAEALERAGLTLEAIWLTHAHFDHVGGIEGVRRRFPVPVLLHPDDLPLYQHAQEAARRWDIPFEQPSAETTDLTAGQVLTFAGREVRCLFTPGHAPGHVAFYLPAEGVVLAGDALFQGSIGRTDLPFGNHDQLLKSIRRELLTLPDETQVLPGHGPTTTIGQERRHNPFLQDSGVRAP